MTDEPRIEITGPLLTAADVADLLGVPRSTVYEWARTGQLPVLRLNPQTLRWTHAMIEEWVATRLDPGRAEAGNATRKSGASTRRD